MVLVLFSLVEHTPNPSQEGELALFFNSPLLAVKQKSKDKLKIF